ncbi:Apoptosis inhibitor 5 [Termitomyces sp. T112]|nr:Apoptosis inhibitor 5 [Termitomyces sp. T112]
MSRPAGEQEYNIKDQLRKAKGHPDRTGSLRRSTLKRLIDLTHSPHPNLKILAARNISFFFTDFPELEEEAINAVYDLCEDQTPAVRIEGYTAVTELSKANNRLVSRNADVLLQLLQSDEPDEVEIVKDALLKHLEMDAKVTLGVFFDQMAPLDDSMDDEEKDIRVKLRKVVLKFLTEDARKAIVERHAVPGSEAEETLIDNLLVVIPKLAYKDVEIIVEEIFLKLKTFKTSSSSSRGSDILKVLLNKVTELLSKASRPDGAALLHSAQPYLDLAGFIVVEKHVAPAILLLREYCSSFANKVNLQKFHQDDQQLVVCRLAETFAAANEQSSSSLSSLNEDGASLDALSRVIVDSCPFLLEALRLTETSPSRHTKACTTLIQACQQRKQSTSWTPRPNLVTALCAVETKIPKEKSPEIHGLIRSLVPPASTSKKSQEQVILTASTSQSTVNGKGHTASLPERPVTSYPARRMHIVSSSRFQDHRPAAVETIIPHAPTATSIKHSLTQELPTRPSKRQKGYTDEGSEADSGPSLLSRMGTTLSNTPNPRTNLASTTTPRTTAQRPHSDDVLEPLQAPPNGELSIRGAARMNGRDAGSSTFRRPQPTSTPSFSLLERLESSNKSNGDGRGWGIRRSSGR